MKAMPTSWSNKHVVEYLTPPALDSLSRMLSRAVAETGTNFQIYDGYRSREEQIQLFKKNYTYTGATKKTRASDRWYNGTVWRNTGAVRVASPDVGSNHNSGEAIDIHPSAIQEWIKKKGLDYGWSWDEGRRVNENWHFRYIESKDRHKSEGYLDHAAVQKVVGASVDGKIGTGTVAKIKEWQKAHGLTPDGIVGPATKKAMFSLKGSKAPKPVPSITLTPNPPTPAFDGGFRYTFLRQDWDTQGISPSVHLFDHEVKGAYLHYPGAGNVTLANETVEQTKLRLRGYRRDHINRNGWFDIGYQVAFDQKGNSYQLRGANMESGANGGQSSNDEATAYLLLVGDHERPSAEMIAAVNGFLAQQKNIYPESEYIRGHQQSPDANTDCPGVLVMDLIQNGSFTFDGKPYVAPPAEVTSPKSASPSLPTGKALLMGLINAPDFPLLRTPAHQCYYGPASGPVESVSGKNENRLNPGDVVNGASIGLKQFQTQLRKRGYSLTADGKYGPDTEKAAKNIQRLAGLTQDGKVGPDTWYASYLLPVT